MKFETKNHKIINIPDNELDNIVNNLHCSILEAVDVWLCDKGIDTNEEQNALGEKAQNVKIKHNAKGETPKRKAPTKKFDEEKAEIINKLYEFLNEIDTENVEIANPTKLITFDFGENTYKLDLVKTRKTKK